LYIYNSAENKAVAVVELLLSSLYGLNVVKPEDVTPTEATKVLDCCVITEMPEPA
jgi:hypothetical protein